jgi:hypothetical protein
MKANEREKIGGPGENARLGTTGSRAVKEQEVNHNAHAGEVNARARALARWENEGGRVVAAARELPGRS